MQSEEWCGDHGLGWQDGHAAVNCIAAGLPAGRAALLTGHDGVAGVLQESDGFGAGGCGADCGGLLQQDPQALFDPPLQKTWLQRAWLQADGCRICRLERAGEEWTGREGRGECAECLTSQHEMAPARIWAVLDRC